MLYGEYRAHSRYTNRESRGGYRLKTSGNSEQEAPSVPSSVSILDIWGPYAKKGGRGVETTLSTIHSISNSAHGKCSRNNSFRSKVCFRLFFFWSQARDCATFTLHDLTDIYVERVTVACIKIHFHSCFHNRWPSSKTKLK